jgi:hypothetical protein
MDCVGDELIFEEFRKIPRLNRSIVVTEKIDGTNAQVYITDSGFMHVGSRSQWITPENDNHGFAKWVQAHREELIAKLGPGRHYGEWWGSGIQRGYGLPKGEKRFSLFNTSKWSDSSVRPECCHVVPVLYTGPFDIRCVDACVGALRMDGSAAAPGFMKPEGVIVYHTQGNLYFKMTVENDDTPKSKIA